jgi:hypothetical protein
MQILTAIHLIGSIIARASFMTALATHLERLLHWLEEIGLQPPSKNVRFVEVGEVNMGDGTYHVRRADFRSTTEYERRFEELLQAGYPWLNMSCYGIHNGWLIVAVEVPSPRPLNPGCATSVNLSGPSRMVLDCGWRVDSVITIA